MNYTLNYNIIGIQYFEKTRATVVTIVCEDTGEIFTGKAVRNPKDKMNIKLATNLATARAVRQAVNRGLLDDEESIIEYGDELQFEN